MLLSPVLPGASVEVRRSWVFLQENPRVGVSLFRSGEMKQGALRVRASAVGAFAGRTRQVEEEEVGENDGNDEENDEEEEQDDEINVYDEIENMYLEEESRREINHRATKELFDSLRALQGRQIIRIETMLKAWVRARDQSFNKCELIHVMRRLRKRKLFKHALKVSDWMANNKIFSGALNSTDRILRLELASRCKATEKAERIFSGLQPEQRTPVAYNALLLGYTKVNSVRRAINLYWKLKCSGMLSIYSINLMASMFQRSNMDNRLAGLQEEAQLQGIELDTCFHNNLLASTYKLEGLGAAESLYHQMLSSGNLHLFFTRLEMANCYIAEGDSSRAEALLEAIEESLESGEISKSRRTHGVLISSFASIGSVSGMKRAWNRLNDSTTPRSSDYSCMIKACGRTGMIEEAVRFFIEAEARLPDLMHSSIFNSIMYVYTRFEKREEAEALMKRMEYEMGVIPDSWCWHHLIRLYAKQGDTPKLLESMRKVRMLGKKLRGFSPHPSSLWFALDAVGRAGDVDSAEELLTKWRNAGYGVNTSMYNRVLRAYLNSGVAVTGFVERMLGDGVRPDLETEELYNELNSMHDQTRRGLGGDRISTGT